MSPDLFASPNINSTLDFHCLRFSQIFMRKLFFPYATWLCLTLVLVGMADSEAETYSYTVTPNFEISTYSSETGSRLEISGNIPLPSINAEEFLINKIDLYLTADLGGAGWSSYGPDDYVSFTISTTINVGLVGETDQHSANGVKSSSMVAVHEDHLFPDMNFHLIYEDPLVPFSLETEIFGYPSGSSGSTFNQFLFITRPQFTLIYDLTSVGETSDSPFSAGEITPFSYLSVKNGDFPTAPDSAMGLPPYIVVPEPGGFCLVLLGAVATWFRRNRKIFD